MKYNLMRGRLCSALVLAAVMMLAACSESAKGLLDTVPASTPMVANLNLDTTLKQAGCRIENGVIYLTDDLHSVLDMNSGAPVPVPVRALTQLGGFVDLTNVLVFSADNHGHDNVATAHLSDKAGFIAAVKEMAHDKRESEDMGLYLVDGWTFAVAGNQMWLANKPMNDMSQLVEHVSNLKPAESVSRLAGIADFLNDDNALHVAVQPSAVSPLAGDDQTSKWACLSVKIEDAVIGSRFCMMESDGKVLPLAEGMQQVSTDFLRYVPQSYVMAAAVGISPDFKWNEIISAASLVGGPSASSVLSMVAPVLSKVSGTVAFAAGPASGAPAVSQIGPDTWDMMVMVHMPQQQIDDALAMLRSYGRMAGLKMTTDDNGMTEAVMPDGVKLYAGNVDGYMALSNREFDSTESNSMTDAFLSKQGALVVNVPADSEIVKAFELPWGFDLSVQLADDYMHGRFSLNGSDSRVLEALIGLLAK